MPRTQRGHGLWVWGWAEWAGGWEREPWGQVGRAEARGPLQLLDGPCC